MTGDQDAAIALTIDAALVDNDGSEELTVEIGGIPVGATLSDGTNSFTATTGNVSADISGWTWPALTITPPAGDASDFTLAVTIVSTEGDNGDAATTKADLAVTVLPPVFTWDDDTLDFAAITKDTYIAGSQYDALAGNDNVALPSDAAAASAAGFDLTHAFHGGDGDDLIVGSKLNDKLYGDNDNDIIKGGAGSDILDGGAGIDTVDYSAATGGITINLATGTVTGADGADSIREFETSSVPPSPTPSPDSRSGTIDLGAGTDSVTMANSGGSVTISNAETITGGTGADSVTLATVFTGAINLNAGADSLTLSSAGSNTVTLSNVETVVGGSQDDKITLATAVTAGVIDLGGGADTLKLANGTNSATVSNAETITGGTGADTVTLGARSFRHRRSGRRPDKLTLSGRQQVLSVSNTETITGGAADSVTCALVVTAGVIDLGGGTDTLTFANGTNSATTSASKPSPAAAARTPSRSERHQHDDLLECRKRDRRHRRGRRDIGDGFQRRHQPQCRNRQPRPLVRRRQHRHGLEYRNHHRRHAGRQDHPRRGDHRESSTSARRRHAEAVQRHQQRQGLQCRDHHRRHRRGHRQARHRLEPAPSTSPPAPTPSRCRRSATTR